MKLIKSYRMDLAGTLDIYEANDKNDVFWVTAGQIGSMLGYRHPEAAILKIHERNRRNFENLALETKVNVRGKGYIKTIIYNFRGALELCLLSHKSRASDITNLLWKIKEDLEYEETTQKSGLQLFNYDDKQIRVIQNEKDELWWVAADVCEVLGLSTEITRRLDEDEKGLNKIQTLGGEQEMTMINESGLYALVIRSNKPEARKFRKWITSEVIPSIRKTGSYSVTSRPKAVTQRISKEKAAFYSCMDISKETGLDIDIIERAIYENDLTTYAFHNSSDWYWHVTEEGREKLLEALRRRANYD